MTTTDQRPLVPVGTPADTDLRSDDPRTVERMVAPIARRAVEIGRATRPESARTRV